MWFPTLPHELYHLQTLRIFCSFLRSHATVEAKDPEKEVVAIGEIPRDGANWSLELARLMVVHEIGVRTRIDLGLVVEERW